MTLHTVTFTTGTRTYGETRVRVSPGANHESRVRARAIQKIWGRQAGWWPDSGLQGWGQVITPCQTGGSTCLTPRVHCRVD